MKVTRTAVEVLMGLGTGALIVTCVAAEPAEQVTRPVLLDVTTSVGLSTISTMSFGATWTDYDRDEDPDLFINRHWETPWFYENRGSGYEKLAMTFFSPDPHDPGNTTVDRHGCAWGEADGRGDLDLVCTRGADKGVGTGPNQLFVFGRDGVSERAARMGVDDPWGRGRSVNWLDYDGDGDLDLFITNGIRVGHPNRMFRNDRGSFTRVPVGIAPSRTEWPSSTVADWDNDGDLDILLLDGSSGPTNYRNDDGRFVAPASAALPDHGWRSATWGDFNGDGWIDVHLVSTRRSVVLQNDHGTFVEIDRRSLEFGRSSAWFDADNDADLDLFLVQGSRPPAGDRNPNHADFLLLQENGRFVRADDRTWRGTRMGNGDGVITADHDGDGRTDLFVTNGHNPSEFEGPGMLFRNATRGGNSISMMLRGDRWNPQGIGVRLSVEHGNAQRWYHVTDGVTARSQSEVGYLVIGLGEEARAEVMVLWPDGDSDCFVVQAQQRHVAVKGTDPC